jgi:HD superfamily phosphodiesterase
MPSNLNKIIGQVEEKWLKLLYNQCLRQFSGVHLPSHDEIHHLRVWNYAKILLQQSVKENIPVSETDVERLMIAVFFHDQGMSGSMSKEHGQISRRICKTFFQTPGLAHPPGFDNVLEAIEKHDQKNYSPTHQKLPGFDIQRLLNIADDLDALGIIGAYRYLEIYLLRNIKIELLPEAVLTNLSARFQHFSNTFVTAPAFVETQSHRYTATRNYFKDLNLQLKLLEYGPGIYLGPIGVVNYIRNDILGRRLTLQETIDIAVSSKNDFYVKHFFERLSTEMDHKITARKNQA